MAANKKRKNENPHIGSSLNDVIREAKKSPEFRKAWEEQEEYFKLLKMMISARKKSGITQKELAGRLGIKQPVLSRLEHGAYNNASFATIVNIAHALGYRLEVKMKPRKAA